MRFVARSTSSRHLITYRCRAQAAQLTLGLVQLAGASEDELRWLRGIVAHHIAVHREYREFLVEQGRI